MWSSTGACLLVGAGVPMDEVEALAHFARAAELSYAPAKYQIGMHMCARACVWVGVGVCVLLGCEWLHIMPDWPLEESRNEGIAGC